MTDNEKDLIKQQNEVRYNAQLRRLERRAEFESPSAQRKDTWKKWRVQCASPRRNSQ